MASFITVDRKILKWEWYQDIKVFHLFLYMLLRANWEDGRWKGIDVKRGQLITGRLQLSKDTGLTQMEIRTCQTKLKTTGEITIKTTNKYSIITICKYDVYQSKYDTSNQQNNQQVNQRTTNEQPTNNQQITTNNNNKQIEQEELNKNIPKGDFPLKPLYFPKKEQFNGLPQLYYENLFRLVKSTKNIEIDKDRVDPLWEVFKEQNLTGMKSYTNDADVYRHFTNWANKQSFRKKAQPKEKKQKEQVIGVEFLNDFKQVKMSDGSIKDLTKNQMDSARFNQINPNSIKN